MTGNSRFEWHCKNCDADTQPSDYLPRRRLGEYLRDFHLKKIARMEKHTICFQRINENVIDVIGHDGFTEVRTEHSEYIVSQAILCIGHQSGDRTDHVVYETSLITDRWNRAETSQNATSFHVAVSSFRDGP